MNKDFAKKAKDVQIKADRNAYRNGPKLPKVAEAKKVVKKSVVKKEEIS